jgi:hypothetical protein
MCQCTCSPLRRVHGWVCARVCLCACVCVCTCVCMRNPFPCAVCLGSRVCDRAPVGALLCPPLTCTRTHAHAHAHRTVKTSPPTPTPTRVPQHHVLAVQHSLVAHLSRLATHPFLARRSYCVTSEAPCYPAWQSAVPTRTWACVWEQQLLYRNNEGSNASSRRCGGSAPPGCFLSLGVSWGLSLSAMSE